MEGAESTSTRDARDACQVAQDFSWKRDAMDAILAKQVVEALAREIAKAHMHYQALETQKEGKYSLDKIESYSTLLESLLAPKSRA